MKLVILLTHSDESIEKVSSSMVDSQFITLVSIIGVRVSFVGFCKVKTDSTPMQACIKMDYAHFNYVFQRLFQSKQLQPVLNALFPALQGQP